MAARALDDDIDFAVIAITEVVELDALVVPTGGLWLAQRTPRYPQIVNVMRRAAALRKE